ncbi:MAG: hypothetical protein IKR54_04660 [Lachnospiraceae bacterium]|nr:hypothetical protein [Lachnospiraceae bacterium]
MGENVLIIDSLPAGEVICPPYKLTPYKEGANGFEKLCVVFEEDFDGDLSIKIFSLMAEDFRVWIDGREYSYAIRGGKQTDPGYAMLAGPFEKGTVIGAAWGKESASVYMQEDVGTAGQPETVEEEQGRTVRLPFVIKGAQSVLADSTFATVLVEVSPDSPATISPRKGVRLVMDGQSLEGEKVLTAPTDAVYSGLEVKVIGFDSLSNPGELPDGENDQPENKNNGADNYRIVVKNPLFATDKEQGPDAFMNVTGSFAGELCYRIGASEDASKGTYHTLESHEFGVDPFTGYYWGRTAEDGSEWAFQLEEGLYGINASVANGAKAVVLVTGGKEKEYKLPAEAATPDGPTAVTIRSRVDNGIVTLRCRADEGTSCPFVSIEIRTLSTTAHASAYIPADMSEDPEEAPAEIAEETPSEVQEEISEEKAEEMPEEVQEEISEEKAEETPPEVQEEISEEKAEEMPAEVQEEVPGEKEEEMPSEIQEAVPEEKEEVPAETQEETPPESREQDVVSVQEKQPAVCAGAEKPRKEYSVDRSLELTEKEYRSAIENYFGPTSHGIDFWDSERKERPEKAPAPEPKLAPIHEPKQEVPAEPEAKPEVAAELEVIPEIEPEVAAESEVIPEIEPEAAAEPEVIPEIEPEVAAEPEVIPEIEPEVAAEPAGEPAEEPIEKPAEEPANKIRVSVYSGSSRKQTSKYASKDKTSGGLSGLFSVFGRKKR